MSVAPVFVLNETGYWLPDPVARGPFEGMQGGAAAALLCAAIEAGVAGSVASVTTHFLRPIPLLPLQVKVQPLRSGRRVSVVDAELSGPGGLLAVQRATVIVPRREPTLPLPPRLAGAPERHPLQQRRAPHGGPWLMDAMEVRLEPGGRVWFRQQRPIVAGSGAMARVLPAADWAHGLHPPQGSRARPPAAIPNPDLSVHLFRQPSGDWLGVEADSAWSSESIGAGWAALFDAEGLIGHVAMSVAVALLQVPVA